MLCTGETRKIDVGKQTRRSEGRVSGVLGRDLRENDERKVEQQSFMQSFLEVSLEAKAHKLGSDG